MTNLNGWTQVGRYGSSDIYAKGNRRYLVDPKTEQATFEYRVNDGKGDPVARIKGLVSNRKRKENENAKL